MSHLFGGRRCPRAEALHSGVINLFNDLHYTPEQASRTANLVAEHLGGSSP